MAGIVVYLIIAGVIVYLKITGNTKGKTKRAGGNNGSRYDTSYSVKRTTVNGKKIGDIRQSAQQRMKEVHYRTTHADEGYDEHMLDYCDSDLSDTTGISFKDVPPGGDELIYLRRYNHQRERELEKALQSSD